MDVSFGNEEGVLLTTEHHGLCQLYFLLILGFIS